MANPPTRPQAPLFWSSLSCQLAYLSPVLIPHSLALFPCRRKMVPWKTRQGQTLRKTGPSWRPFSDPPSSILQPLLLCRGTLPFCCGTQMCSSLHFKTAALTPISSGSCQIHLVSPFTAKPQDSIPFCHVQCARFCSNFRGEKRAHIIHGYANPCVMCTECGCALCTANTAGPLCPTYPTPFHVQCPPAGTPISPRKILPLKPLMNFKWPNLVTLVSSPSCSPSVTWCQ